MIRRSLAALPAALVLFACLPAFAAVTAEKAERQGLQTVVVTWTDANRVDVYRSDQPDAPLAKAKLVSDDDADGRYEAAVGAWERPYFILKDTRDGKVVRVAERVLPLAQGSNFRDIGGYRAAGGKHVRWGKIFRSGATPMLTDQDVAEVKSLGVRDLIDLRSDEERVIAPTRLDGIRYSTVGYSMQTMNGGRSMETIGSDIGQFYGQMPSTLAPQFKLIFDTLLDARGPVAYNCSAGQDRTGVATALVLSALGVPRDVILADYHLSTTYRRPEYEMPKIDPAMAASNPVARFFAAVQDNPRGRVPQPLFSREQRPLLIYALDAIDQRWGSVDAYLQKELGVGPAELAKLRALYLE
jgi:protein-tyrosine phosphatase